MMKGNLSIHEKFSENCEKKLRAKMVTVKHTMWKRIEEEEWKKFSFIDRDWNQLTYGACTSKHHFEFYRTFFLCSSVFFGWFILRADIELDDEKSSEKELLIRLDAVDD